METGTEPQTYEHPTMPWRHWCDACEAHTEDDDNARTPRCTCGAAR